MKNLSSPARLLRAIRSSASVSGATLLRARFSFTKLPAQLLCGLFLAAATLGLSSCAPIYYYFPQHTFANRPIPPSQLANRVMVSVTSGGSSGSLQILDANRDLRNNIENTVPNFQISGYGGGYPNLILNFPEEVDGYVYSNSDGSLTRIDYGKEASAGSAGSFPAKSTSLAVAYDGSRIYSAEESTGQLVVIDNALGRAFALNLPNVYRVAVNQGGTVALAMVRNSDTLYRIVYLNANQPNATTGQPNPPGAVDCQPYNLPVYCVVPVPGTYDRPIGAYFSLDGTSAFVLNCGPECGGSASSVTSVQQGALTVNIIPTSLPYPDPTNANIPVPGGATVAVSDGTTLYVAGQQLQPDGLFGGNLSSIDLASKTVTGKYSISDGNHTKILFADDNTLWIGSQLCATGERAKLGINYNCLTRFDLGAKTAAVLPAVTPGSNDPAQQLPYPNNNNNRFYYGDLTGLCWVQNLHKVYTAYGGQVHAFHTNDGSEINNFYITVQGTALDVAYMDALTNAAN